MSTGHWPSADGHPVEVAHLSRLFGWLTAAVAALMAVAGMLLARAPGGRGGSILVLPIAVGLLLFRQFGARLLESLGKAITDKERLEGELASLHEEEERFRGLAYQDALTGLPNQRLFHDRLGMAIEHSVREKSRLAVLYLDLDGFKAVNDTLGHGLGDRLLGALGARIRGSVRGEDTVARLGGDEFAVLLPRVARAEDAARVASKVMEAVSTPFHFGGSVVSISASVGVSVFPDDGRSAEDLVRQADAAMYRAKHRGRASTGQATPAD
jgi:diguanylate cyclase (GGDEF)-like protein